MKRSVILILILALFIWVGYSHSTKELPVGVSHAGPIHYVSDSDITFLVDETYLNDYGERIIEQTIFDEIISTIQNAEKFILIDMFLYNDFQLRSPEKHRALALELTQALIDKKEAIPDIKMTVVTDPLNGVYGGAPIKHVNQLKTAGIDTIVTDLTVLRDSNPVYSSIWRLLIHWSGNSKEGGFLKHPFELKGDLVTARSYLTLLNMKANHRKVIVADASSGIDGVSEMVTIVTSANPHDGSSAHENIAVRVEGDIWEDVYFTERATAEFSGSSIAKPAFEVKNTSGPLSVQLLTEGKIAESLVRQIEATVSGDSIRMIMFYLSDRRVINALVAAANRGVDVDIVMDPNKDAFGHEKNGVPNRPVGNEFVERTDGAIDVVWCLTNGEQCHSKVIYIENGSSTAHVYAGSANLTRRNIGDYNLETNVLVSGPSTAQFMKDTSAYIARVRGNENGRLYTVPYDYFANDSLVLKWMYRFTEFSGISSF